MFLTKIKANEIIGCVKPEFAQFAKPAKRVTYKPLYVMDFPKFPENRESNFHFMMQHLKAEESPVNEQIMAVQGAIESYAKQKGVNIDMARKIDIIDGKQIDLADKIAIDVYNPKTKSTVQGSIPVFEEDQTINMIKRSKVILDNVSDGTQVVRPVQSEYEGTFVRYLYCTIENLVKKSFN